MLFDKVFSKIYACVQEESQSQILSKKEVAREKIYQIFKEQLFIPKKAEKILEQIQIGAARIVQKPNRRCKSYESQKSQKVMKIRRNKSAENINKIVNMEIQKKQIISENTLFDKILSLGCKSKVFELLFSPCDKFLSLADLIDLNQKTIYVQTSNKKWQFDFYDRNIYVRPIDDIISQTRSLYQNAVEANFSHEQMTPLNCISNNSEIIAKKAEEITKLNEQKLGNREDHKNLKKFFNLCRNSNKQLLYSARNLKFYNENQIQRMKIQSGQIELNITPGDPSQEIQYVLEPFLCNIQNRNIEMQIKNKTNMEIMVDWAKYKLIVFNLVQNAVKYNKEGGSIQILFEIEDQVFRTLITNTGQEISPERIPQMMKIFGELDLKLSINKVKDKNIGVGLTCAKVISQAMGGDLKILENKSEVPCTSIQLDIPTSNEVFDEPLIKKESKYSSFFNNEDEHESLGFSVSSQSNSEQYSNKKKSSKNSFSFGVNLKISSDDFDQNPNEEESDKNFSFNKQKQNKLLKWSAHHKFSFKEIKKIEKQDSFHLLANDSKDGIIARSESEAVEEQQPNQQPIALEIQNLNLSQIAEEEEKQISQSNRSHCSYNHYQSKEKKYKLLNNRQDLKAQLNRDSLAQGISIQDLDKISEEFQQNDKHLRDFDRRHGFDIEDSEDDILSLNDQILDEDDPPKEFQPIQQASLQSLTIKRPSISHIPIQKRSGQYSEKGLQCKCEEAILIVDDTEYNLLPLIYYIGQLRVYMKPSESQRDEEEKWQESKGPNSFKSRNAPEKSKSKSASSKMLNYRKSNSSQKLDDISYLLNSLSCISVVNDNIFPEKARNGEEAVQKFKDRFYFKCKDNNCKKKYFKLIIMDLMMPVMDGFEATKKILDIQNQEIVPQECQCQIVALTSNTDQQTMDRCKEIGFAEVLHKPLDFETLKRIACLYHYKMTNQEYQKYLEEEKIYQELQKY